MLFLTILNKSTNPFIPFMIQTYTTKSEFTQLTYDIIGAAIHVHRSYGPGLLESIYHECMRIELEDRGIPFESELMVPLTFNGRALKNKLRCDLLVNRSIVVELKSVSQLLPIHDAQLLTYMKLLNVPKGIVINFNCDHLFSKGQKTLVNHLYRDLQD